jgi:hypothetical protein
MGNKCLLGIELPGKQCFIEILVFSYADGPVLSVGLIPV